jgi:hypothetical protein
MTTVLAGCGSSGTQGLPASATQAVVMASTPTAISSYPPSPPEYRPTAVPTAPSVLKSTGWLVYLRGTDLYLGTLDGSPEQRLTTGSAGAGYAGLARSGGITWLYYTSMTDPTGGVRDRVVTFDVFRRALFFGSEERLFSFTGNGRNAVYPDTNASVSPDGRYVAYTDANGIELQDVALQQRRTLLANGVCDRDGRGVGCFMVSHPVWSPDGSSVLVTKGFYESAVGVLMEDPLGTPMARQLSEPPVEYGGVFRSWAPDGQMFCASETGYAYGGTGIVDVAGLSYRPLDDALERAASVASANPRYTTDCVYGPGGALAVTLGGENRSVVAIRLPGDADFIGVPMPPQWFAARAWLPDLSGVVVDHRGAGPRQTIVLSLDGSLHSLPFVADRVLGGVPQEFPPKDD